MPVATAAPLTQVPFSFKQSACGLKYSPVCNKPDSRVHSFELAQHDLIMLKGFVCVCRCMALALAPHNVRVNAIGPGSIMTDVLAAVANDKAAMNKYALASTAICSLHVAKSFLTCKEHALFCMFGFVSCMSVDVSKSVVIHRCQACTSAYSIVSIA